MLYRNQFQTMFIAETSANSCTPQRFYTETCACLRCREKEGNVEPKGSTFPGGQGLELKACPELQTTH